MNNSIKRDAVHIRLRREALYVAFILALAVLSLLFGSTQTAQMFFLAAGVGVLSGAWWTYREYRKYRDVEDIVNESHDKR